MPDPRRHRRDDAAAAHREGRQARRPAASVSPTGKRAAFEARGDVFTVPAEYGAVVNVTRSSGVAERYPRWSPDGKTRRVLERPQRRVRADAARRPTAPAPERKVTSLGAGLPLRAAVVARQQEARVHRSGDAHPHLRRCDAGKTTDVDKSPDWIAHGGLENFRFQWSPDSRWLTYARPTSDAATTPIFLYDTKGGEAAPGDDRLPERHAADVRSGRQVPLLRLGSRVRSGLRQLRQQLDLRRTRRSSSPCRCARTCKSPLAARNDAENARASRQPSKPKKKRRPTTEAGRRRPAEEAEARRRRPTSTSISTASRRAPSCCRRRPGNYADLQAVKGKLLYRRAAARRLERREERRSSTSISRSARRRRSSTMPTAFEVTLRRQEDAGRAARSKFAILEIKAAQKFEKPMATWPTWRRRSIRAPSGGRSSPTRSASSATSSTTRACTASTGPAMQAALRQAARRRGHALGRRLRASASSSAS